MATKPTGNLDVGASLVNRYPLLVVVSGSAIGREGAPILPAALAAFSFLPDVLHAA